MNKGIRIIIIILIISFVLLIFCSENQKKELLNVAKEQDFLIDEKNTEVIIDNISEVITYKSDQYIFVNDKARIIYVTNKNLIINEIIDLKNKDYLFNGNFRSTSINGDKLYISDNNNRIKVLNLTTHDISSFEYEVSFDRMRSFIGNFEFINDSIFICASHDIQIVPIFDTLHVGAKYNIKGKLLSTFPIEVKKLEYNSEVLKSKIAFESCYVTIYRDKVYFSFAMSKKLLVYNLNGVLENIYELNVDKNYWQAPHETEYGFRTIPVNGDKLLIFNDAIFQVVLRGESLSPQIHEYSMDFKEKTIYEIGDDQISGYYFMLRKIDNYFLLKDNPGSLFYILESKGNQ